MLNLNTSYSEKISADRTETLHIARRLLVTCYNSAKPPETSRSVRERPKTHSFSLDAQVKMAFVIEMMLIFQLEYLCSSPLMFFLSQNDNS